jgi:hypothetical protein
VALIREMNGLSFGCIRLGSCESITCDIKNGVSLTLSTKDTLEREEIWQKVPRPAAIAIWHFETLDCESRFLNDAQEHSCLAGRR